MLNPSDNHSVTASESKDRPEAVNAEVPPGILNGRSNPSAAFRRFGVKRYVRETARVAANTDLDGYLLVLLADQELAAGRDHQAHSLLDAAYTEFDRHGDTAYG
jgi:hypothetical protein